MRPTPAASKGRRESSASEHAHCAGKACVAAVDAGELHGCVLPARRAELDGALIRIRTAANSSSVGYPAIDYGFRETENHRVTIAAASAAAFNAAALGKIDIQLSPSIVNFARHDTRET